MKRLCIFLPISILFFFGGIKNLQAADIIDDITATLKNTDTKGFAKYFSPSVDIEIFNHQNTFTATQSQLLINDFFSKNTPTHVQLYHKITSNATRQFAVIIYNTLKTKYRISLELNAPNGKLLINQITIEAN